MRHDRWFAGVGAVGLMMAFSSIASADAPQALTDFFASCPGATCQIPLPTVVVPACHAAVGFPQSGPQSACVTPSAAVVQASGYTWLWSRRSAGLTTLEDCFAAWQRSASELQALTDRDLKWLTRSQQGRLSAHACELAARLLGPVEVARLRSEFDWAIEDHSPAGTVVVGTPRDDVTRMFTKEILVAFDARSGTVQTIALRDRDGRWCEVERPTPRSTITLAVAVRANSDDDLPPSPTPPNSSEVRFASDVIEFEVQLRR